MSLDKQRMIFLVITSSKNNAHASLQNWSTIHNAIRNGFALAPALSTAGYVLPNTTVDMEPNLYLPSDPHSRPFDLSLTHIQHHHPSHRTDAPPTPLAPISPSVHYLQDLLSILILRMFYKLSRPMPTHIYRATNERNLDVPTKLTHPPLLSLAETH